MPRVGQQVYVVIELAPSLLLHAVQYPEGQAIPGEKKAVGAELKPLGRHGFVWSSMNNMLEFPT